MSDIKQGTAAFRRVNLSLFLGGFVTFAVLYCTQPLMPVFSNEFQVTPAVASFSLSVTTATLSVCMMVMASLSAAWGRKPMMTLSLLASALLIILTAFSPNFITLLAFRTLEGIALSGLPAIAMAYLGEEVHAGSLGMAMGLYISGNSIGGMCGRIITGMITDFYSWRIAMEGIGMISLIAAILFWINLPASTHFKPRPLEWNKLTQSLFKNMKDPRLLCIYGIGFALMGSFVTLYNYIGYQLIEPPYDLSQTLVGWIFIVYLVGTFSSTWMGKKADRMGYKKVLWENILLMLVGAVITLDGNLFIKILGIAILTFGFFGGHSVASSWVGSHAITDKAQASSLYLFFYYAGSSLGGTTGGIFLSHFGWGGVVGLIVAFLLFAFLLSTQIGKDSPAVLKTK